MREMVNISAWQLAAAAAGTVVASFLAFSWLFDHGIIVGDRVQMTAGHTASYARDLSDCTKREQGLGKKGARDKCLPIVKDLLLATQRAPRERYDFYKASTFEVFLTGRYLTLVKASCSDADLAVKTFAWNAWPNDPSTLPPDRNQYGNFSGIVEFPSHGFRLGGACLLVIDLPTISPHRFYVGQRQADGKYLWVARLGAP